jgi:predicted nucleic acid-binding protein
VSVFFDTSVLFAAFLTTHEHHTPSFAAFLKTEKKSSFCAAHTLAELYSTFTRFPGAGRLSGSQVLLFIESIRQRLSVVSLTTEEYDAALEKAANLNIAGGAIYDLLLAQTALKCNARQLLTWNIKHFTLFGPAVSSRVRTPSI